jgi:hypothetical protein
VKWLRLLVLPIAALALAFPTTGVASLPKPQKTLIDVPKAIGAVKLEQKLENADKAWGERGECDFASDLQSCVYLGPNSQTGQATIEAAFKDRVTSFAIEAGLKKTSEFAFKGRLLEFETPEGIGLGDKRKTIKKAYPTAIRAANNTGFLIEGRGKSYMTFQTLDSQHVTGITVVDGNHQG